MLAVQTHNGYVRVWSVPKVYRKNDPAKVRSTLKRADNHCVGRQWMGWSKDGHIMQFSGSEVLSWDVKKKNAKLEFIIHLEHVRGITVYGPGAVLLTLGANNTVRKFELSSPPPTAASVELSKRLRNLLAHSIDTLEADAGSVTVNVGISESGDDKFDKAIKVYERSEDVGEFKDSQESEYGEDKVKSCQSSIFDQDIKSKGTRQSTVPTSHPSTKPQMPPQVFHLTENQELVTEEAVEAQASDTNDFQCLDALADDESEHQQPPTGDSDTETTYSVDSRSDDTKLQYLQEFAEKLADDIKSGSATLSIEEMEAQYLDSVLKEFAWKLYGESSNPFEWEASVVFHRKRKDIVELLVSRPLNHDDTETQLGSSSPSEDGEGDELSSRPLFKKPRAMVMQWVRDASVSPIAAEEPPQPMDVDVKDQLTPQLPRYKEFIQQSEAYQWLLNRILQHDQLSFEDAGAMMEIGSRIRSHLRTQTPLRKMSSRKPLSLARMTFNLDWDPVRFAKDAAIASPFMETLPKHICLTGSDCG
ncbi:hypothetical protein IL306_002721 [Fusarium sp. DS 682]|nr:hypothetical protein IL306_002721 [Fusarium sp. DS 682]